MSQYIFYHISGFELEDGVSIYIHFSAIDFKIYVDLCNIKLVTVYMPKPEHKYL